MFLQREVLLVLGAHILTVPGHPTARQAGDITEILSQRLSSNASVSTSTSSAARWSDYHAPEAQILVNVAEEQDVAQTITYCNENNLRFLAQSGGNGWATTFDMRPEDVIINLRGLNSISLDQDRLEVSFGGGITNDEFIQFAYDNGLEVLNGGCDCVGVLGSTLGGGVSRWMNRYGLPADNLISVNLVTADGELIHVSEDSDSDLLWAIRGAGPNFGVVTSATMRAYPTRDEGMFWAGELIFSGDKLERYIETVNNLNLTEDMTIHWGFSHLAEYQPVINAEIFWMSGDAEAGRRAFQPLYDLEPDDDTTQVVQYNHLNDDTAGFCEDGGRKPGWHVGLRTLDYPAFQAVWDNYVEFVNRTGLTYTGVLVECYSNFALREIGSDGASYPHRDINFYAMTIAIYDDSDLDSTVESYGSTVRDTWRESSGFEIPRAYVNFAHGDEPLEEIYGESLPRLRALKQQWDPNGRFNQWFPIT